MLKCEGCESGMGKSMPCFTPNYGIFPIKMDGLNILIKNNDQFLFKNKEYYLRLGNEKSPKFLGVSPKNPFKNYIRLQIGFKDNTIIYEEFLRNNFYRIIWTLTDFFCRFKGKDRYFIYENPIWAWPQRIIINGSRHWFGYELAINNYLKAKGYRSRFQYRIIKDGFGNIVSPDFIIDPNEKYKGKSFIVEAKFRNFDFIELINKESPDIIKKKKFNNLKWRAVEIEGLKSNKEFIYKIINDKKLLKSDYKDFLGILNQVNKYSSLIHSDCGVLLSLNTTINVEYNNKLIKFIETPLYDMYNLKFCDSKPS